MELYLLLISHLTILLPIFILIKTFSELKLFESLIILSNVIFTGISSIIYHSYSYESINKNNDNYREWAILDYYLSRVVIVTTVMYVIDIRQPYIYIYSHLISLFFLFCVLFIDQEIISYLGLTLSIVIALIKYKFLIKLFFFQKVKFILTIIFLILSAFFSFFMHIMKIMLYFILYGIFLLI